MYIFVHRGFLHIKVCSTYSLIQEGVWVLFLIAYEAWVGVSAVRDPQTLLRTVVYIYFSCGTWLQTHWVYCSPIYKFKSNLKMHVYDFPDNSFLPSHQGVTKKIVWITFFLPNWALDILSWVNMSVGCIKIMVFTSLRYVPLVLTVIFLCKCWKMLQKLSFTLSRWHTSLFKPCFPKVRYTWKSRHTVP